MSLPVIAIVKSRFLKFFCTHESVDGLIDNQKK